MSSLFGKKHTFRVTILWAFISLFLFTVVPIIIYTYLKNTDAILEVSDNFITQVQGTVIEKTVSYLAPAAWMSEVSSRLVVNQAVNITDNAQLESYAIEIIKTFPQLAMFNVGDENGNFHMTKRMPDGTIATKLIRRDNDVVQEIWKHRDHGGQVIKTEESDNPTYDPRVRPWYQGAQSKGTTYWSDIYIFFTDKVPGITSSYPVKEHDGSPWGVVGVDIELGEISRFLQTLKIGNSGIVYILNEKDEVVAHPDINRILKKLGDELRPVRINEIGIDWLVAGFEKYKKSNENKFTYRHDEIRYITSFTPFPKHFGKDWIIAITVPEDVFIGDAKKTNWIVLIFSLIMIVVGIVIAGIFSRQLSCPIVLLTKETEMIKNFHLDATSNVNSRIYEIKLISNSISNMKTGLKAFEKYVPAELVRQLIQTGEEAKLGGHNREITILFSDIRNFSSITEQLEPQELMLHLSEYLDVLTNIILEMNGTVDKYIGDSIMAFWGAPLRDDNHAFDACRAALKFNERLAELNKKWESEGKIPFQTRIGIHTGVSIVGNVGSAKRMSYTAMGDTVNIASRIEALNKIFNTNIIITESTHAKISEKFITRSLDVVTVKGKKTGIRIFELKDQRKDQIDPIELELCENFDKGLQHYLDKNWDNAKAIFEEILQNNPLDQPSKIFVERCSHYKSNPLPQDWNGVFQMTVK